MIIYLVAEKIEARNRLVKPPSWAMSSLTLKGKASDQAPALANIQAAQKRPVSQPVSQPKPKEFRLKFDGRCEGLPENHYVPSLKASIKNDLEENDIESGIDRLLKQLQEVNMKMQDWVSSGGSEMVSHTLTRAPEGFY
ncbi:hypothetical protein GOBAR_DD12021 [Gossypium barbadense]|nr:hypothetical protein GOBAR_DD12021 [Gossypium barbadense]